MFYKAQENELKEELEQLSISIARREEEGFNALHDGPFSDDGDSDDDDMSYGALTSSRRLSMSRSRRNRSMSGGSPLNTRRNKSSGKLSFSRLRAPLLIYSCLLDRPVPEDLEAGPEQPLSPITPGGASPNDMIQSKSSVRSRPTLTQIITQPRAALADIFNPPTGVLPETVWTSKSTTAYDIRMLFKRRISNLYTVGTNLKAYVELNHSGFRKILKK